MVTLRVQDTQDELPHPTTSLAQNTLHSKGISTITHFPLNCKMWQDRPTSCPPPRFSNVNTSPLSSITAMTRLSVNVVCHRLWCISRQSACFPLRTASTGDRRTGPIPKSSLCAAACSRMHLSERAGTCTVGKLFISTPTSLHLGKQKAKTSCTNNDHLTQTDSRH